jgi:ribosomal-protein-serine acetyltransferase
MIFKYPLTQISMNGVHLRPLAHYQADAIFKAVDRNRDHLKPWLTWVDDTHDVSDTRDRIKTVLKKTGKGIQYSFSIWCDDRCIGMISFININLGANHAEIGYWLDKDFTGHGIMTHAVETLLKFGFDTLKVNKIQIWASTKNFGSAAIPDRLGFHQDAIFRQYTKHNGQFHDCVAYSMLGEEWKNNTRLDRPDHPA